MHSEMFTPSASVLPCELTLGRSVLLSRYRTVNQITG